MASPTASESSHRVQFYEAPAAVASRIAAYLRDAIVHGGAGIAVVRPELGALIAHELRGHCLDVDALICDGRLVLRDADRELARFMDGSVPDRAKFRACMLAMLDGAREAAKSDLVHVYGEMVDALWSRGEADAVRALERLWTELGRERRFRLTYGYRLGSQEPERDVRHVPELGSLHDHVEMPWQTAGSSDVAELVIRLDARARALENEIARRVRAEDRMHRLLQVTSELAAARTRDDIARVVIETATRVVDSSSATVWRVDGTRLVLLGSSYPGSAIDGYRSIALADDTPVSVAARTGEPEFVGSLADYQARYPESFARMAPTLPGEIALAIMPVVDRGQTWAVLLFTYDDARPFDPSEQAFQRIIARQSALALERIALQDEERAAAAAEKVAREEIELVYQLITQVNATDDLEAVYQLTLDAVMRGSRSDRAAILLFDPDGVMRFKASRGLSESYRRAVEGHTPWRPDTPDPAPVMVDDTETDPAWGSYRDIFRAERLRALAFVPLIHQRKLVGKLMLYRDEPRAFAPREIQLTSTIAVHVAQAVERTHADHELARAYREEREAHLLAEEATHAREEILSVVSHDLRNPLGTVMIGASTLLGTELGDKTGRVRTIAERIHRQAERMARMIDDLVDFAGIQAGQLALVRGAHSPAEIVAAARDMFAAIALERGLVLDARTPPVLGELHCDGERLLQALGNLISNAFKVTPRGGRIDVGAEARGEEIVFYVRDTGPGIDADDMPNLFERFWRSKKSTYRGAGLGLSIARGIVDAHGGRIWVDSRVGAGSTFYFALSSLRAPTPASSISDECPP